MSRGPATGLRDICRVTARVGTSASGDGRNDRHGDSVVNRGLQSIEKPNIVIGDKDVHEPAEFTIVVEQALLETGVGALEIVEDFRDRCSFDLHLGLAGSQGAKGGRNADNNGHDSSLGWSVSGVEEWRKSLGYLPLSQRPPAERRPEMTVTPASTDRNVPSLEVGTQSIDLRSALLMGIVNATPDSFSEGGRYPTTESRVALALELIAAGAGIVDVGGQSGITGVPEIEASEEVDRVLPVIEAIRAADPDVLISVDTYKPLVVEATVAAGASIINDVSGLLYPDVAGICADSGAALVIMHNRSKPKVRLTDPLLYADVTEDVIEFLGDKLEVATDAGLPVERIIFDPGIDFAKTPAQTIKVLRDVERIDALGRPVLFALSRKDFIGALNERPPRQRRGGTLATIAYLGAKPGHIYRVHDVVETRQVLDMVSVISGDLPPARTARGLA